MRLRGKIYRSENYHLDSFRSNREQNFRAGLIFIPLKFGICEGTQITNRKEIASMNEPKKAIDMTPEELEQWLDTLETDEATAPTTIEPDPYVKREPLSGEQRRSEIVIDENDIRRVKNESAYWIPEITISEKIGNTVYTITGTYEGETSFVRKLERIMARKFAREMEDGNDTFTNL